MNKNFTEKYPGLAAELKRLAKQPECETPLEPSTAYAIGRWAITEWVRSKRCVNSPKIINLHALGIPEDVLALPDLKKGGWGDDSGPQALLAAIESCIEEYTRPAKDDEKVSRHGSETALDWLWAEVLDPQRAKQRRERLGVGNAEYRFCVELGRRIKKDFFS